MIRERADELLTLSRQLATEHNTLQSMLKLQQWINCNRDIHNCSRVLLRAKKSCELADF